MRLAKQPPRSADERLMTLVIQLRAKIARRNYQIKHFRSRLKELSDFLGDARIEPPLPATLSRWLRKEIERLER